MDPIKSFMVPSEKFITVERDTDVRTAAGIMRDRHISSLFVTKGEEIVGILTDTDMVRRESVQTRCETGTRRREALRHTRAVCRRAERRDCPSQPRIHACNRSFMNNAGWIQRRGLQSSIDARG